ncbi:hypothetical protein MPER_09694 [Moniliophthora perniciosa FA553]|nr:hypothetical protein MPER_09694 [Moniliophthora perniciosa FA553]
MHHVLLASQSLRQATPAPPSSRIFRELIDKTLARHIGQAGWQTRQYESAGTYDQKDTLTLDT